MFAELQSVVDIDNQNFYRSFLIKGYTIPNINKILQ